MAAGFIKYIPPRPPPIAVMHEKTEFEPLTPTPPPPPTVMVYVVPLLTTNFSCVR
jgi:hypothetical protein